MFNILLLEINNAVDTLLPVSLGLHLKVCLVRMPGFLNGSAIGIWVWVILRRAGVGGTE